MARALAPFESYDPPLPGVLQQVVDRVAQRRAHAASLPAGLALDHAWRVVRPLRSGPLGERYLLLDEVAGRQRILETFVPAVDRDVDPNEFQTRLNDVIETFRSTAAANVVSLITSGRLDSRWYLVWARVIGVPLPDHVAAEGPLAEADAQLMTESTLEALAAMQASGWHHGHITAETLLVHRSGQSWLGGWGPSILARLNADSGPDPTADVRNVVRWFARYSVDSSTLHDLVDWLVTEPQRTARDALVWLRERPARVGTIHPRPRCNVLTPSDLLIGRTKALEDLKGHVDAHRLVTLVGPAGVGKTRLALEWTARALVRDPEVVVTVVDVAQADEDLAFTLARTLALVATPETVFDRVLQFLRGHPNHVLLVDNCEVRRSNVANTLSQWLVEAPSLRCLATSREGLGVVGERVVRVEPLATEGPESEAVRLFLQRAQTSIAGSDLVPSDLQAVEQLVASLDGLPLAIELAAARVGLLSAREMLERMSARFAWLRTTRPDVPPRRASLRGALETSWDLLRPNERRAAIQLAVFVGSFTLEDAEWVLELSDVPTIDLIERLLAASWLSPGLRHGTIRMLVSIRAFALDHLRQFDAREAVQQRHAERFAQFGRPNRHIGDELSRARLGEVWTEAVAAEAWARGTNAHPRLAILLRTTLVRADTFAHAMLHLNRLVQDLPEPLDAFPVEGASLLAHLAQNTSSALTGSSVSKALYTRALDMLDASGKSTALAAIYAEIAWFELRQRHLEEASKWLERAFAASDHLSDRALGYALAIQGLIRSEQNREHEAIEYLERARTLLSAGQTTTGFAEYFRVAHGFSSYRVGDLDQAAELAREAAHFARRARRENLLFRAISLLFSVQIAKDDLAGAESALEELAGLCGIEGPLGIGRRCSLALRKSAWHHAAGRLSEAKTEALSALRMAEEDPHARVVASAAFQVAKVALDVGELDVAQTHLDFTAEHAVMPLEKTGVATFRGLLAVQRNDPKRATLELDEAIQWMCEYPMAERNPDAMYILRLANTVGRVIPPEAWLQPPADIDR
ncbi:MAG: AAA family ATPase [Myxococcota bacterium]